MDKTEGKEEHNVIRSAMSDYQIDKAIEIQKYYLTETLKLSIVTSPLYCLSTSFQFINKELFSRVKTSKIRLQTFKPSFYLSYKETITNLTKQGVLGLYKGNFWRMSFFILSNNLKQKLDYTFFYKFKINKILKEMILYSCVDICLNPLLFIESRYIIQNRLKNVRLYNNLYDILRLSYKDLYRGCLCNIPRNILFITGLNSYWLYPGTYSNYIAIGVAHLLSYPLLTIQRNIYFHINSKIKGDNQLIRSTLYEREFKGVTDGLKYFYKEFGILSLYRGVTPYLAAVFLWHYWVPKAAKARFYDNIFANEKAKENVSSLDLDSDDEDEESVAKTG
jgi:hypothetical protein